MLLFLQSRDKGLATGYEPSWAICSKVRSSSKLINASQKTPKSRDLHEVRDSYSAQKCCIFDYKADRLFMLRLFRLLLNHKEKPFLRKVKDFTSENRYISGIKS